MRLPLKNKQRLVTGAIVLIVILSAIYWGFKQSIPGHFSSYAVASERCGHSPVIGTYTEGEKIYYKPGQMNNDILSLYNPNSYDASRFRNASYFCSVDQAVQAGYAAHKCCGKLWNSLQED